MLITSQTVHYGFFPGACSFYLTCKLVVLSVHKAIVTGKNISEQFLRLIPKLKKKTKISVGEITVDDVHYAYTEIL